MKQKIKNDCDCDVSSSSLSYGTQIFSYINNSSDVFLRNCVHDISANSFLLCT